MELEALKAKMKEMSDCSKLLKRVLTGATALLPRSEEEREGEEEAEEEELWDIRIFICMFGVPGSSS